MVKKNDDQMEHLAVLWAGSAFTRGRRGEQGLFLLVARLLPLLRPLLCVALL